MTTTIQVGTRSSELALRQTRFVTARLHGLFPSLRFTEVPLLTPGDRDQTTPLADAPPDFFTRDLDDQVISGAIDCAVHSAKDLPDPPRAGIAWFWLPWREDARDALVCRHGLSPATLPGDARIGVSSARRMDYCRCHFPGARLLAIRGDIPARLRQLDEGAYDMIVVAAAALNRLGLAGRVSRYVPLDEMAPPDGQGALALTFRANDERLAALRGFFVKAVTFAGGGSGSHEHCTIAAQRALARADVCLHDALLDGSLAALLPPKARCINVGKRAGGHGPTQEEINAMLVRHSCQGARVVRLKGGDPGIFGRLAEETAALDACRLPYRVLPGVSSLNAATTATGMLLTRRGESPGFTACTPRRAGGGTGDITAAARARLPLVLFMAIDAAHEVARQLIAGDGLDPQTPAAAVFNAGSDQEEIIRAPLADIAARLDATRNDAPGLLLVGPAADGKFGAWGPLAGCRVLVTSSETLQERAAALITDAGGIPVCRPLIRLTPNHEAMTTLRRLADFDWVLVTSPSAVRCLGALMRSGGIDLRQAPRLAASGAETAAALREMGLPPDLTPSADFGSGGLADALRPLLTAGSHVLRLASEKSSSALSRELRASGAAVEECLLYHNTPVCHDRQPQFDAALFASSSAVESLHNQWGAAILRGKVVAAIGRPTREALNALGVTGVISGAKATMEECVTALAAHILLQRLPR